MRTSMRPVICACLLLVALLAALGLSPQRPAVARSPLSRGVPHVLSPLPLGPGAPTAAEDGALLFLQNQGQFAAGVAFTAYTPQGQVWLTETGIWLTAIPGDRARLAQAAFGPVRPAGSAGAHLLLRLAGADLRAPAPSGAVPARIHFLSGPATGYGSEPAPAWHAVRYAEVYPGVDLEVSSRGRRLALRLVCRGGCRLSPDALWLQVAGAAALRLTDAGLTAETAAGDVSLPLLELVTETGRPVAVARPPVLIGAAVGAPFQPAAPARSGPTTVTAAPLFSTFLGGGSDDSGWAVTVSAAGHPVVVGETYAADFPVTPGAFDLQLGGSVDVFVASFTPDGSALDYATFLGGSDDEHAGDVLVDQNGSAIVVGQTFSEDFPTSANTYDPDYNGSGDAFVTVLDPTGARLLFSSYLGGSDEDAANAGGRHPEEGLYLAGRTASPDFPTVPGALDPSYHGGTCGVAPDTFPCADGFLVHLSLAQLALTYGTYLGGPGHDEVVDLAADGSAVLLAGGAGPDFPVTPGVVDPEFNGCNPAIPWCDAFVARLDPVDSVLIFSTYLGGSNGDWANSLAVDVEGGITLVGPTASADFPTSPGAYDTSHGGGTDAFVTQLSPLADRIVYSTFYGGAGTDFGNGVYLGPDGGAVLAGGTDSADLPTTPDAVMPAPGGLGDAFLAWLRPDGSGLQYGSYLGSSEDDWGYGVAGGPALRPHVTGYASAADFPVTAGAYDPIYNGGLCGQFPCADGFLTKLPLGGELPVTTYIGPAGGRLTFVDGQGSPTTIEVPAGAVTETIGLFFRPLADPGAPPPPSFQFVNHNFDLTAQTEFAYLPVVQRPSARGAAAEPAAAPAAGAATDADHFQFLAPVTVTVAYSDGDVGQIGDENSLRLYVYDEAAEQWMDAALTCPDPFPYTSDPAQNVVQLKICHISKFGLVGN